ncbi:DUF2088 domain-containing protein [bacterium]|nr:DUF2088 domain-containing protein [bacterium]
MTIAAPSRDRCVVKIDRSSAARVLHYGEGFLQEKLPEGTRVLYPPPPLQPVKDVKQAVRYAISHPEGSEPLFALLKPGMKVTIGLDDISIPLPPMATPDVRQSVLEVVLEQLAQYGVDDVHLIVATSLHRRMTEDEIRRMVGSRIFRAYHPDRLYNHDAEDRPNMVKLGETPHKEPVWLSRRAAESDLVIYVNVNLVPMDGGHKSVGVGLTCYETLRSHHNPKTILESWSFMDPARSALAKSCNRIGKIVNESVRVFTIETTVNNRMFGDALSFLMKNEDDWNAADDLAFRATKTMLEKLPRAAKRAVLMKVPAAYGITGVFAGATDAVHPKTLESCFKQYSVPIDGPCDVLVSGVPYVCPYNVNSIMNPLLVHCTALGYFFNMYRGSQPLLRKGGVLIVTHPLYDEFDADCHPSYIEFFHRLLTETRDSKVLERDYEERFARDPAYIHMFRTGKAYHPVHCFYMWYWGEAGRAHAGKVIVVGAESKRCAEILGWDVAPTLDDALGEARAFLGKSSPDVTVLHHPPLLLADLK